MDNLPPKQIVEYFSKRLSEPCINKDALVKLLKKGENALSNLSPCSSLREALASFCCSLIQSNLVKHKDDDVKLLVAVCFAEITRLLAPNPPCSYEAFTGFLSLIIDVLKRLTDSNSPYSTRRLKILETITYCKSFLIMFVDCEDLTAKMFDMFFKAVRNKMQSSLVQAISSIMTSILELQVAPCIMYVILHNLLRQEKAASFRLAVSLFQDCTPKLETSVCSFLTSCMLDKYNVENGQETDCSEFDHDADENFDDILEHDALEAELRSSYHDIILKIYQYAPQTVSSILPILTQELLVDQVDARLKAVVLIGKILVLSKLSFCQVHHPVFSEFLKRFSDKSTEVRLATLEWAKAAYQANPSSEEAHHFLVGMEGRLLDFDDKVRTRAISVICNLADSHLSYFPSELVLKAIKRLRDKKVSVRKSTTQSLLEVYRAYCIKCSDGLFNLNCDYENIPCGILMLCFDKGCKEFSFQSIELVIARDLFPPSLSVNDRKKHWIVIFSLLTQFHLKALKAILAQKQRLLHEMQAYLVFRDMEKENASEEVEIKLLESISKMAATFLDSSKATECLEKLHNMRDGYIFKSLKQLVNQHTTMTAANSIRVTFLARIGKKHPDYEFFRILSLRCSYTIFSSELVQSIVEDILYMQPRGDKSLEQLYELLLFIVRLFPSLLKGSEDLLLKLFKDDVVLTNEKLVHIIAVAGCHVSVKLSDVYPFLEKMCLVGTRVVSKFAIQAISSLKDPSDNLTFLNLCQKLVSSLQSCQNVPTILQSLSSVARYSYKTYKLHEKQVANFIILNIFESTKLHDEIDKTYLNGDLSCSSYCMLKIYAMKTLFKSFLSNHAIQASMHITETINLLENTIQGKGIIYNNISSEIDKDCLRLTSTKLLLQFAARFDSYIPPKLFYLIIARSKDPSCSVRKTFLFKVHKLLKENLIPLRYSCVFVLASTDFIGEIRDVSRKFLAEFIEGRRKDYLNKNGLQDENGRILNSPEYIVVFLIHILAHDQCFPSPASLANNDSSLEICIPLVITLRALVDLEVFNGNKNDVRSNLYAILRAIKKADDAVDAQFTPKLHILSDAAILILKSLGDDLKTFANLRRTIFLPSSFYKVCQHPTEVYDTESFINENFVNKILDAVEPSIIKPYTASSKRCVKHQVSTNNMGFMKNCSVNVLKSEGVMRIAHKAKSTKHIDSIQGNALNKEFLQKRVLIQPSTNVPVVGSVSTDMHVENSDVYGGRNLISEISVANMIYEQQSCSNSANTKLSIPGLQTLASEHEAEILNPSLTKRMTKCDSIAFRCDKNIVPDNFLTAKESVNTSEGSVGHTACICPPVDMCCCSASVDSCDSLQNFYKVSYDNENVEPSQLGDKALKYIIQKPFVDMDSGGFQPRDCNVFETASNTPTVSSDATGNAKHRKSSAIVGINMTKKQRQSAASAMKKESSNADMAPKNAARRTRSGRA